MSLEVDRRTEEVALLRANRKHSRRKWEDLPHAAMQYLDQLGREHNLSVASAELIFLNGNWYVTHSGLLRIALRNNCLGIHTRLVLEGSNPARSRWAFEAIVYKSTSCKGLFGYGDADPDNVSVHVNGAEMRVAETRAVNRALRKAYGIGICSAEELGSLPPQGKIPPTKDQKHTTAPSQNGHHLRDRLLVLVRQHQLDPGLVKLYAADFCGVSRLKDITRGRCRTLSRT